MLRAAINSDVGLATYSARDEFNQTAGNLVGKTAPVGGVWAGAGDADTFSVETTGHTATRTAVSDVDINTGRYAISGVAGFAAQVVQVDAKADIAGVVTTSQAAMARYVDTSNWLQAGFQYDANRLQVVKRVAATRTVLFQQAFTQSADAWYTHRLFVNAAGAWFFWSGRQGSSLSLVASGQDADLATGGALASGKPGFYDYISSANPSTRNYDNFGVWVPTDDAVLFASQSAELRTEGVFREDSTGVSSGPVPSEGDLMRIPPPGLEARPAQLFLKPTRGDFGQLPDSGIDDIYAQVFFRPSWLFVPGS